MPSTRAWGLQSLLSSRSGGLAVAGGPFVAGAMVGLPIPNYANVRSYADPVNRPAFTPTRTVTFSTATEFNAALSGWADGDLIKVAPGAGVVVIPGEIAININAPTRVVIDLGLWTDTDHAKFTGFSTTTALPAIWVQNTKNLTIYGGEITNPAGSPGVLINGGNLITTSGVIWYNFYIHDTGGTAFSVFPTYTGSGPGSPTITNCDFEGEVTNWGLDPTSFDPHIEKGTGLHGCNCADVDGIGIFTNNRVAINAHDGGSGAALEVGQDAPGTLTGNTFYVKAVNLTKVATSQTAANAVNLWGSLTPTGTFGYIEATNLQGRAVQIGSPGTDFSGYTVSYGRATNTNQNPNLGSIDPGVDPADPWDDRGSGPVVYQNVL